MKLPLRLVASILLTSVHASSGWPYHEIVGSGQSTGPLHVGPVYGVAPATASLLPTKPIDEPEIVIAGPVADTTVVEGPSSGPVTVVLSPGTHTDTLQTTLAIQKKVDVPSDAVLIKGPSVGPVTLLAPIDAATAEAERKKSAAASVTADVAKESADKLSLATTNGETSGIATGNAVIGPSIGPIVIAGPTAPPNPPALTATPEPVTVSIPKSDASAIIADATDSTRIESSASSTGSVTSTSASTTATARVNLITPAAAAIASSGTAASLSNVVVSAPSAVLPVPAGTVTSETVSSSLLKSPFQLE
ncbi:uncharacterized protein PB18E9.04c-like [Ceratina calcarata]|uniref:Uncharacterized protein PB18E9.04c-like n=1 Tax=Ceratina calcarata TaxID=156304 RepID=A0AAJ7N7L9_9HYME|nr:uncharacterized protein PB18E9.04c-like [Ceratina calcarata]